MSCTAEESSRRDSCPRVLPAIAASFVFWLSSGIEAVGNAHGIDRLAAAPQACAGVSSCEMKPIEAAPRHRRRGLLNCRLSRNSSAEKHVIIYDAEGERMAQTSSSGPDKAGGPSGSSRLRMSQQTLQERVQSAPVVVVGSVREVRKPIGAEVQSSQGSRISEHDPDIAEAVITVVDGIKGAEPGSELAVRFPASNDVRWYDYPKFRPGETGVFILQPDTITGGTKAVLEGAEIPTFTVPRRSDVLPVSEADRVRSAVKAGSR
jgi:hypothetical protein